MNKQYLAIGGVVVLALALLTALWWYVGGSVLKRPEAPAVAAVSTKNFIVLDTAVPYPEFPRTIEFADSLPAEAQNILQGRIDTLVQQLNQDPHQANVWLDLALQYKTANDLDGAREVWEYLIKAAPQHSVSFYNLGYHYHISDKDFPRSEEYYKKAIEIDSAQEAYYVAFHELYRYSYRQNTTAAVDILKQGLEKVPSSINLRLTLAGYYRDEKKDKKSAIQYFTQARDLASEANEAELVMSLDKEISTLSK